MYDAKEVTLEMTGVPEVSALIAQIQDEVKGIAEVSKLRLASVIELWTKQ